MHCVDSADIPKTLNINVFVACHLSGLSKRRWGREDTYPICPQHSEVFLRQPLAILVVVDTLRLDTLVQLLPNKTSLHGLDPGLADVALPLLKFG